MSALALALLLSAPTDAPLDAQDELKTPVEPTVRDVPPPAPPMTFEPNADTTSSLPWRGPGIAALWLGGIDLTVATFYGGITSICIQCRSQNLSPQLVVTTGLVGGGILALLAGMGYLAWVQPADEPWPKSPGVATLITGLVELGGGALRALLVSNVDLQHDTEYRLCAGIMASGVVALAAGILWLALAPG